MLALASGSRVRWQWLGTTALGLAATLGSCVIESGGPTATDLYRLIDAHCLTASTCECAWALPDPEACTPVAEARWKARISEAQGRDLTYDAACLTTLVEQIETRGCSWQSDGAALCESFCAPFHGDRPEGESCTGDDPLVSDCAQGLVCAQGTCTAPCDALTGRLRGERCGNEMFGSFDDCAGELRCNYEGICEEPPGEGAPCPDGNCGEDLYCDWNTNRCVPGAAIGESCLERSCQDELFCNWQDNRCIAPPGEGEPCYDWPCADDLFCQYSDDGEVATCRRPAAEGEGCSERPCESHLWCSDLNVCVTAPEAGEPCLYGSICAAGLVCDPEGLCAPPPEEGQPCPAGVCAFGSWCDTATAPTGICAPRRANDEQCSGHRQCLSSYCPNGFCWPLPLEGDDCQGTDLCGGGLVCNGTTCEPTLTRAPATCSYPGW